MNGKVNIKKELYRICEAQIEHRITTVEKSLASIKESKNNETKSSAGDKYETGRAMMQMEEEKYKTQLLQATHVMNGLTKMDLDKKSTQVEFGSLVKTNLGHYFISIGIGKLTIDDELYFCASLNSPIGMIMMGKVEGDEVEFNGKEIKIQAIC